MTLLLGAAPADECGCCWRNGGRRTPLEGSRPPLCRYCTRMEYLDVLPHGHSDLALALPLPPSREDRHTTTVDGAAAHARQFAPDPTDCHHPDRPDCIHCVTAPY